MEIGSFIEFQLPKGKELYNQETDIVRLNTGRSAIWHAFRVFGCKAIWIPYYQCDSVRNTLKEHGAEVKFIRIEISIRLIFILLMMKLLCW